MSVYVDDMAMLAEVSGRKARWSHLLADTSQELSLFAEVVGLSRSWLQRPGTVMEHYDVTAGMRSRCLRLGAIPITVADAGRLIVAKRHDEVFEPRPYHPDQSSFKRDR